MDRLKIGLINANKSGLLFPVSINRFEKHRKWSDPQPSIPIQWRIDHHFFAGLGVRGDTLHLILPTFEVSIFSRL